MSDFPANDNISPSDLEAHFDTIDVYSDEPEQKSAKISVLAKIRGILGFNSLIGGSYSETVKVLDILRHGPEKPAGSLLDKVKAANDNTASIEQDKKIA